MYFDRSKTNESPSSNQRPTWPRPTWPNPPYLHSITKDEIKEAESRDELIMYAAAAWDREVHIPSEVVNSNGTGKPTVTLLSFIETSKLPEMGKVSIRTAFSAEITYDEGNIPNENFWNRAERFKNVVNQNMWGLIKYKQSRLLSDIPAHLKTEKEFESLSDVLSKRWKDQVTERLPLVHKKYLEGHLYEKDSFDCAYLGHVVYRHTQHTTEDSGDSQTTKPTAEILMQEARPNKLQYSISSSRPSK